jgi:hypothetical protein
MDLGQIEELTMDIGNQLTMRDPSIFVSIWDGSLDYYEGNNQAAVRTEWKMHEYTLRNAQINIRGVNGMKVRN